MYGILNGRLPRNAKYAVTVVIVSGLVYHYRTPILNKSKQLINFTMGDGASGNESNRKRQREFDFEKFTTIEEFGYEFRDGKLTEINSGGSYVFVVDPDNPAYNQKRYEALGEVLNEEVYSLLEKEGGLKRREVTGGSFVFVSEGAEEKNELMVLIHGAGVVRAGQWARRLIINDNLECGTQLPYIKWAQGQGMGVVVMNTNHNRDGKGKSLPGSESPEEHGVTVWKQFVQSSKAVNVFVVAHSYGGFVVMELAKKFRQDFLERVKGLYLTDSVHRGLTGDPAVDARLKEVGTNYVASDKPLDTQVSSWSASDIPLVSAGHTVHEWTSHHAKQTIFDRIKNLQGKTPTGDKE